MTLLKGFDVNNDLAKIYEEKIPYIKPKNLVKEQEVICEDISVFLNQYRDTKKQYPSNMDYSSNNPANAIDDKAKKKIETLIGIKKQDYSSNTTNGQIPTGSINIGSSAYESTDNKSKNDFQKFLVGMNTKQPGAAAADPVTNTYHKGTTFNTSVNSTLHTLKGDTKYLKVN